MKAKLLWAIAILVPSVLSRKRLKCCNVFAVVIGVAITLFSCVPMPIQRSVPTETDYIDVDYRRFVSGLYVNELKNKYVKIDCAFVGGPVASPLGYPSNYMSFAVTGPAGLSLETPGTLTVLIPKNFTDVLFSLRHGDQIQIRGRAIETVNRGARGSVVRKLFLQADGIQKKQEVEKRDAPLFY